MIRRANPRGIKAGLINPVLKYPYRLLTETDFRKLNWFHQRVSRKKRFEPGSVNYDGDTQIHYCDSASFLSAFEGIFVNTVYDFGNVQSPPYFVDAGANIGLAILYWMRRYPGCQGIAFEPDPSVRKVLEVNLGNWKSDFTIKEVALAADVGELEFFQQGGDAGRLSEGAPPKGERRVTVKTDRLSNYLDREVDLLKIDIEGAEYGVLKECADSLSNVKRIFVESHSFVGAPQDYGNLLGLLQDCGFRCFIDVEGSSMRGFRHTGSDSEMDLNFDIFAVREDYLPTRHNG